jgi:diguanylate cyclase (GGDEF)-like protein
MSETPKHNPENKENTEVQELKEKLAQAEQKIEELALERDGWELKAKTDEGTGLLNRRGLALALSERRSEYEKVDEERRGEEGKLSLTLIDIDDFKKINDTYGHQVGDQVIRAIGRELKQNLTRSTDIIARVGGEEFAIVVRSKDLDAIKKRFYPDLKEGEHPHFRIRVDLPDTKLWVTTSGGTVEFDVNEDFQSNPYVSADKLLYQAKQSGKDKIIIQKPEKNDHEQ